MSIRSRWLKWLFKYCIFLLIFHHCLSITGRGVSQSAAITVILCISLFSCIIMNLFVLSLVLPILCHVFWSSVIRCIKFRIVMSFGWTSAFIIIKCFSLFLTVFFVLKYLSDINIANPAFCRLVFLWYTLVNYISKRLKMRKIYLIFAHLVIISGILYSFV